MLRFRQFVQATCLAVATSAAPAATPGDAAVARCFELRDSNPAAAVDLADAALKDARLPPDVQIKLRTCLGRSLALTGDAGRAEAEVAKVDALLTAHSMPPEFMLRALSNSGATLHTLGEIHRALDYYERAYEAARRSDSDIAQAATLINVASIHSEALGAYAQAEAFFAQAEAAQDRTGSVDPRLPYNRGLNYRRMGRRADALRQFSEAEDAATASGQDVVAQRARAERIALQAPARATAGARASLAGIARRQQTLQDPSGAATTLLRVSELSLQDGDAPAALTQARQAAALVEGPAFRGEQHDALAAELAAYAAQGNWRQAFDAAQRLREAETSSLRHQTLGTLADLQARLHDTQNERELQRLRDARRIEALRLENARRLRNASIGAFIVLALLGGAFAYYQRRVNRRLHRLSTLDGLTGLLNRRAASRLLQAERAAAGEDERRGVVFLIDIDHFKARNDRHGHAAGDAVLAEVARCLRACCRPEDVVARWGGEEFLVGCRQLDLARAGQVAERLRAAVGEIPLPAEAGGGPDERLSVSIGFAGFPVFPGIGQPGDWQDALALADRALYAAKHGGRDAWVGLWGRARADATIAQVVADPAAQAERGAVTVVASRQPVRWREHPPA